jgi:hypothetical protein
MKSSHGLAPSRKAAAAEFESIEPGCEGGEYPKNLTELTK